MAWIKRLAYPAGMLLGAVFLFAAVMKLQNIGAFAVEIDGYGVVPTKTWLGPIAIGTVGVEMLLGTALVLGLHLGGWTPAATTALLLVLTALIANGWMFHGLENCGCFGFEMSPGTSILKNVFLILLGVISTAGHQGRPPLPLWYRAGAGLASAGAAIAALFIGIASLDSGVGATVADRVPAADAATPAPSEPAPLAGIVVETPNGPADLGKGEYLVALLSASCEHCMAAVPTINELTFFPDLPPLVGLVLEEKTGDMAQFQAQTGTVFPLHSLGSNPLRFYKLIDKVPPRLAFTRDGYIVHAWDETMPLLEDVLAVTSPPSAAGDSAAAE